MFNLRLTLNMKPCGQRNRRLPLHSSAVPKMSDSILTTYSPSKLACDRRSPETQKGPHTWLRRGRTPNHGVPPPVVERSSAPRRPVPAGPWKARPWPLSPTSHSPTGRSSGPTTHRSVSTRRSGDAPMWWASSLTGRPCAASLAPSWLSSTTNGSSDVDTSHPPF